ncbi:DUF2871 domain-containing protein [Amycolatopsis sp. NPDC059021]|uniref:DUF2871 domain-containing protein n=1 Tax=Amycolatopsis sp. NPDC059021 TaxID=3346704 RepID=UPI00366BA844
MKKLYWSVVAYTALGLLAGLYYRELTKANDFTGDTQLSVVHTHLLALGTLFFLIVVGLEKLFTLSAHRKLFAWFFWLYNVGTLWTVAFLVVHGTLTVLGKNSGAAIAGMAGLGHILLSAGLVVFLILLHRGIFPRAKAEKA